MKIVNTTKNLTLTSDQEILTKFYLHQYQSLDSMLPLLKKIIDVNTFILYSGSWRFKELDVHYLEPNYLKYSKIQFNKKTSFTDNLDIIKNSANKFKNVTIIDSILTRYKSIDEINSIIKNFNIKLAFINIDYIHFNRLSNSYDSLCKKFNGYRIENFIVKEIPWK